MPEFTTPTVVLYLNFSGGSLDLTYSAERGLTPDGPWVLIKQDLPLLAEQAVMVDNTAPIGIPLYYRLTRQPSEVSSVVGPYQLPDNGHAWISDPARPWADLPFDTCPTSGPAAPCTDPTPEFIWGGLSDLGQDGDAGLFEILNSDVPADVWARRKSIDGAMTFFTRSLDAAQRVQDLFTAGGPLQLRIPTIYGWTDAFIQPGRLSWEYGSRDQRRPLRRYTVPFRVVGTPFGPIQGIECANWCEVQAAFPTFGDMAGSGSTWLDLALGEVLCPTGGVAPDVQDSFTRNVVDSWGVTDTGQTWTTSGGTPANYDVNGTAGTMAFTATGVTMNATVLVPGADVNARIDFSSGVVPTGNTITVGLCARENTTSNLYMARISVADTTGAMTLTLRKRVAGTETQLTTVVPGINLVAGTRYSIRLSVVGSTLRARVWAAAGTEPTLWQTTITDTSLTTAGSVGLRCGLGTITNPLPVVLSFDNLWVGP